MLIDHGLLSPAIFDRLYSTVGHALVVLLDEAQFLNEVLILLVELFVLAYKAANLIRDVCELLGTGRCLQLARRVDPPHSNCYL